MKETSDNLLLEKYLLDMGGRIPFEMALNVLGPVIRELAEMHAKGMCHLDICPENIAVDPHTQTAFLLEPGKKDAGGYTVLKRPGYSAIEQYKADGDIGAWTDVYAVGAVLYRVVMGKKPPEAFARMENDTELKDNIIDDYIDFNRKEAWLRSLNITVEGRTKNCGKMAEELLSPAGVNAEIPRQQAGLYAGTGKKSKKEKKERRKNKIKWIPIGIACALAAAAASYFGWVEYNYQKLVGYVENEYFTQAADIIPKMPLFYKDMEKLQNYNYAGRQLKQGNYNEARRWFKDLGDFQKSQEMLREVDYQEASSILKSGDYDRAKKAFQTLGDYKESQTKATECDYRKAADLANKEDYLSAYEIFKDIRGYADVDDKMLVLRDTIYYKGVELYRSGDKSGAERYFDEVNTYMEADTYLKLIDAQFTYSEEGYQKLIKLVGFEDTVDIIMNDDFIYYYLLGKWSDGNGYYFWLKEKEDGGWRSSYNMPWYDGDYFHIMDRTYKTGYKLYEYDTYKNQFKFTFVSENVMNVYCYKNNRTYELYRE